MADIDVEVSSPSPDGEDHEAYVAPKTGFLKRIFHREPKQPVQARTEEAMRQEEQERADRGDGLLPNHQERIRDLTNTEDLVYFLSYANGKEFQQLKIQEKHEKPIKRLQQICRGELNYEITADGEIKHKKFYEAVSHGARILGDKGTMISTGLYAVVGVLGGFGIPGMASLAGRVVGRGLAEMKGAKKERELRAAITENTLEDFENLRLLSKNYVDNLAFLSPEDKADRLKQITDIYYKKSQKAVELASHLEEGDKRLEKWGKIGGFVGLGAGFLTGLTGISNLIDNAHFHGRFAGHAIRVVDHQFGFAQSAAEHAAAPGHIGEIGGTFYHAMHTAGKSNLDAMKMFGTVVGGILAVNLGWQLGGGIEKVTQTKEAEDKQKATARLAAQEKTMRSNLATSAGENTTEEQSVSAESGLNIPQESGNYVLTINGRTFDAYFNHETSEITHTNPDPEGESPVRTQVMDFLNAGGRFVVTNESVENIDDLGDLLEEPARTAEEVTETAKEAVEEPETPVVDEETRTVENEASEAIVGKKYKLIDRDKLPRELKNNFPAFFTLVGYGEDNKTMTFKYKFKGEEKTRNIMTEKWPEVAQASQMM